MTVDQQKTSLRGTVLVPGLPHLLSPERHSGYKNLADAMAALGDDLHRRGVERLVYTSSVAVLGINRDRTPADETTPVTLADMIGAYKRSKFLAEQAVRRRAEELGFPVVIVNPSTPIGPGDVKPTPTGRIILDAAAGKPRR